MRTDDPFTEAERLALCEHPDHWLHAYLLAVECGEVGKIYETGRGASVEPRLDGTLESYASTLKRLYNHVEGTPWADVSREELQEFLDDDTVYGTTKSKSTAAQQRSAIRGLYKFLVFEEVIRPRHNPALVLRARGLDPVDQQPVSDEDWLTVITSPHLCPDDRLPLGLGYYCGLRRFEIVHLSPEQVDPLHRRIRFFKRKGGKTKTGLEYGELIGVVRDNLPHLAEGTEYWIDLMEHYARYRAGEKRLVPDQGVKYPGQRLADHLEHHILPEAGLRKDAFTWHMLRHSFGTNLALCDVPDRTIADQMSHSGTETTARYINQAGQIKAWRRRQKGQSTAATAWERRPSTAVAPLRGGS